MFHGATFSVRNVFLHSVKVSGRLQVSQTHKISLILKRFWTLLCYWQGNFSEVGFTSPASLRWVRLYKL